MTEITAIETANIQDFVNKTITISGKQSSLFVKDIIIDDNPINRFYESICQNIGQNLRILFITSPEFKSIAQNLIDYFEARGFAGELYLIQEKRIELKIAQKIAFSIQDDTRVIIAVGGGSVMETAKIASSLRGLPLALYYATPVCEGALTCYSQAYDNGVKKLFDSSCAFVICVDMSLIGECSQNYIGAALGSLASKYLALFDWYFGYIFSLRKFDYQIYETALSVLDNFLKFPPELLKKEKKAYLELIQTQLKISALTQLSQCAELLGGGHIGALNVLEMFFHKENRPLRLEGENLFLCSKIILRAYKLWLSKLESGYFICPPDNTSRLEKFTDYLGVSELAALDKILVLDDYEQWEIMQYKWIEYKQDLIDKITRFSDRFEKYERVFKRVYDDAGFWTTKYLTDTDIMLMIGLAPDALKSFCLISFVKLTGQLDKYLEGV
jgi:glycerol-1-phosphate dehydrogenase [NAD(P)+]